MNPSLKFAFDEIFKRLDAIDARMERSFSRICGALDQHRATADPRVGVHELRSAAQFEAVVEADNWGGLFERPADASEERNLDLSDDDYTDLVSTVQIHAEKSLSSIGSKGVQVFVAQPIADQFLTERPFVPALVHDSLNQGVLRSYGPEFGQGVNVDPVTEQQGERSGFLVARAVQERRVDNVRSVVLGSSCLDLFGDGDAQGVRHSQLPQPRSARPASPTRRVPPRPPQPHRSQRGHRHTLRLRRLQRTPPRPPWRRRPRPRQARPRPHRRRWLLQLRIRGGRPQLQACARPGRHPIRHAPRGRPRRRRLRPHGAPQRTARMPTASTAPTTSRSPSASASPGKSTILGLDCFICDNAFLLKLRRRTSSTLCPDPKDVVARCSIHSRDYALLPTSETLEEQATKLVLMNRLPCPVGFIKDAETCMNTPIICSTQVPTGSSDSSIVCFLDGKCFNLFGSVCNNSRKRSERRGALDDLRVDGDHALIYIRLLLGVWKSKLNAWWHDPVDLAQAPRCRLPVAPRLRGLQSVPPLLGAHLGDRGDSKDLTFVDRIDSFHGSRCVLFADERACEPLLRAHGTVHARAAYVLDAAVAAQRHWTAFLAAQHAVELAPLCVKCMDARVGAIVVVRLDFTCHYDSVSSTLTEHFKDAKFHLLEGVMLELIMASRMEWRMDAACADVYGQEALLLLVYKHCVLKVLHHGIKPAANMLLAFVTGQRVLKLGLGLLLMVLVTSQCALELGKGSGVIMLGSFWKHIVADKASCLVSTRMCAALLQGYCFWEEFAVLLLAVPFSWLATGGVSILKLMKEIVVVLHQVHAVEGLLSGLQQEHGRSALRLEGKPHFKEGGMSGA